jgi:acetyl coenzyme A synthetase (ADP forming)-like protein
MGEVRLLVNGIVEQLKPIFYPRSIAVVGASRTPGKMGHEILRNIIEHGFKGEIYPVNPEADSILGFKTYPNLRMVHKPIDLALIVVPAQAVPQVMEDCAKLGIRGVVILSAGFSETGEAGAKLERRILRIAGKSRIRVIGPNCTGIVSTRVDLNASWEPRVLLKGNVSFITQSGAFAGAVIGWAAQLGVGLNKVISIGNKIDVDEKVLLRYLAEDPETKVIMIYLEGLRRGEGRAFLKVARSVSSRKPIVVLKAGRSIAGARSVRSHTGSMAGEDKLYEAAFKQAGIIRAATMEELLDFSQILSLESLSPSADSNQGGVAIITNAGGLGVLAADVCEDLGLRLSEPGEKTKDELKGFLPSMASLENPIDMVGDAGPYRYETTIRIILADENVNGAIVIFQAPTPTLVRSSEVADALVKARKPRRKPVVACWTGGTWAAEGIELLRKNNVPLYPTPERAVKAMYCLLTYLEFRKRLP